ncbi:L-proline glycine betaine ABC transport system permease protein ProV [Liberibacter crescens BT-1]|uniref:L-proline glycine betaine ABC transport system permease protein ProV n=1 Tax=Liberibacter crescens (strain BT-1) TaxID=1215343 RepID=L0EU61_LIBCB|nr:choline ABC transporter ATP-binding protein [Liberibacter crescens]AGA65069.1 L-proline glycine betaine ABC transport system permease protein ProV [Liberibacter crescens BT-1]AMC13061.1 hemolysin [Liberibacter crescens]
MSDYAVKFSEVDIVFGSRPRKALKMIDGGATRDEIDTSTGMVLAVINASLEVKKEEILVLMGLSGSGKSTLLRSVNGLAPVTRGEVLVATEKGFVNPYATDARTLRHLRMNTVSMVFQQFALFPWRTVADNVGLGLELLGISSRERKNRIYQQLELVNLTKWADRKVRELSGGMQQRVGLARAFATGAPILLMDEPFSSLDPLIRVRLQDELLEFQRKLKKTIIFVSHDLDEAFRLGNRIVMMEGGSIVQCGTPKDIILRPANHYVSAFVEKLNPINMLIAGDVMRKDIPVDVCQITGTAVKSEPLINILAAMARQPGSIGVVKNGAIIGVITAEDIIKGLTCYRR